MSDEPGTLNSVRNALRMLKQFSGGDDLLGVTELSRRLGIAKSTTHRLLTTLASEGFVHRTEDGRYGLGLALWELGSLMVHSLELREVSHPVLAQLRNDTGETVHVAVLDGVEVVYIDRFESPSTLGLWRKVGYRNWAHATSSGKAMLAFAPPEVVDAVLATGLPRQASGTVTDPEAFRAVLAEVRERGYVMSRQESEDGVASVGAPIFGHEGHVIGSVSVAGPMSRMSHRLEWFGDQVRAAADEISRRMGYLARRTAT